MPTVVDDLVRIGDPTDGGYVLSQRCVDRSNAMLSLGIGDNWSFDQHWHNQKPTDLIHGYDGTLDWSQLPALAFDRFHDLWRHPMIHFPLNIAPASAPGQISLDRALSVLQSDSIFIKMDIEGGEWELCKYIAANNELVSGMVIEFHDVGRLRSWFQHRIAMLQQYFDIVHIHGNNTSPQCDDGLPSVLEVSFCHRRYIEDPRKKTHDSYIAGLDYANNDSLLDFELFFTRQEP